jgi:hypothetical protein
MRRSVAPCLLAVIVVAGLLLTPAAGARSVDRSSVRPASSDRCGPGLRPVGDDGLCTHGGDAAPPVLEPGAAGRSLRLGSTVKQLCAKDGRQGPRIRVFYGYPSDTASRAATFIPWVRSSVALADANLDARTRADGQHLRMYCQDDRAVTVTSLALLPIGADGTYTFTDVIGSLTDRVANGLGASDFETPRVTYVVFVDNVTCCYPPSGQGTVYMHDDPDPRVNANNLPIYGPRFAMVEINGSTATGAYVFLHEVGHTIGAVQHAAPHSSGAGHCYEAYDVMCYPDGGPWFTGGGGMLSACDPMPSGQYVFDCRGRDYYDPTPPKHGYLSTHWNTADSAWLTPPQRR